MYVDGGDVEYTFLIASGTITFRPTISLISLDSAVAAMTIIARKSRNPCRARLVFSPITHPPLAAARSI
jgi:hypothetical protein